MSEEKKKETLQEKTMSKPTTNKFIDREEGKVYMEKTADFVCNDDIRKIPAEKFKDAHYNNLFESIKQNGFLKNKPIEVMKSTGYVIGGNHRLDIAKEQAIEEIPVMFVDVSDYESYVKTAFLDNLSKASKLKEIARHIKAYKSEGMTVPDISKKFGISEKSVYDVFNLKNEVIIEKVSTGELSIKNALELERKCNKPIVNDEVINDACTMTTKDLKKKLSAMLVLLDGEDNDDNDELLDNAVVIKPNSERVKLFLVQVTNYDKETINAAKLVDFLSGNEAVTDWR